MIIMPLIWFAKAAVQQCHERIVCWPVVVILKLLDAAVQQLQRLLSRSCHWFMVLSSNMCELLFKSAVQPHLEFLLLTNSMTPFERRCQFWQLQCGESLQAFAQWPGGAWFCFYASLLPSSFLEAVRQEDVSADSFNFSRFLSQAAPCLHLLASNF